VSVSRAEEDYAEGQARRRARGPLLFEVPMTRSVALGLVVGLIWGGVGPAVAVLSLVLPV
jgi:hypothetical protein